MGIFMITISQISSHTAIRVYPGNPGLDLPLDQLLSGDVVLRDDEGRPPGRQELARRRSE
jgi:hypothetical protein